MSKMHFEVGDKLLSDMERTSGLGHQTSGWAPECKEIHWKTSGLRVLATGLPVDLKILDFFDVLSCFWPLDALGLIINVKWVWETLISDSLTLSLPPSHDSLLSPSFSLILPPLTLPPLPHLLSPLLLLLVYCSLGHEELRSTRRLKTWASSWSKDKARVSTFFSLFLSFLEYLR